MKILDKIPVQFDLEEMLKKWHLDRENEKSKDFQELVKQAGDIARPKAIYAVSYVENKNWDTVNIEGIRFTSRVLRVNLDKIGRVFSFVVTCGKELDEIDTANNFLAQYWLDEIKSIVLDAGIDYLSEHIERQYKPGQMSEMNPGSGDVDVWPIEQQKEMFSIFGNVEDLIGVHLTESYLMTPNKTVSGIYFPTEITFESCQLCQREVCSERSAPYDQDLVRKYREKI